MKYKVLIGIALICLGWSLASANNFGSSYSGKEASVTFAHTSALDSAWAVFGYDGDAAGLDSAQFYDSLKLSPAFSGDGTLLWGDGLKLDSIGVHVVKIRGYASGAIATMTLGIWENRNLDANMIEVSGDATAADNLEDAFNCADTTAPIATLALNQLWIVSTKGGNSYGMTSIGSGTGAGIYAYGTSAGIFAQGSLNGMRIEGTDALSIIGTEYGILSTGGDAGGGAGAAFVGSNNGNGLLLTRAGTGYDLSLTGDGRIHGTVDRTTYVDSAGRLVELDEDNTIIDLDGTTVDASCDAAGARTVVIQTLDYSDSTTGISGVMIDVYDSTGGEYKQALESNTSGLCTLSLDDSRYAIHLKKTADAISGGSPQYKGVASDTTHTFYVDQFDPGAPPSADKCRVWCLVYNLSAAYLSRCKLSVEVPSKFTPLIYDGAVISRYSLTATSNDTGYVYVDIYEMEGANRVKCWADTTLTVKAKIELRTPTGALISRTYKAIPDATDWKIVW